MVNEVTLDESLEKIIRYEAESGMTSMEMLRRLRENSLLEEDFEDFDFSLEQWVDAFLMVSLFLCEVHRL